MSLCSTYGTMSEFQIFWKFQLNVKWKNGLKNKYYTIKKVLTLAWKNRHKTQIMYLLKN